jgi:hypothetical protein
MPSPEQIEAAMPAMRKWCGDHDDTLVAVQGTEGSRKWWATCDADHVLLTVKYAYPGGVEQLLADHPLAQSSGAGS